MLRAACGSTPNPRRPPRDSSRTPTSALPSGFSQTLNHMGMVLRSHVWHTSTDIHVKTRLARPLLPLLTLPSLRPLRCGPRHFDNVGGDDQRNEGHQRPLRPRSRDLRPPPSLPADELERRRDAAPLFSGKPQFQLEPHATQDVSRAVADRNGAVDASSSSSRALLSASRSVRNSSVRAAPVSRLPLVAAAELSS
jgi:hypothetical protein